MSSTGTENNIKELTVEAIRYEEMKQMGERVKEILGSRQLCSEMNSLEELSEQQ